ncbi:hypothetical protein [Pusillimonas minor]|uniref:Uncharacterized protein n=1 Tax=Pusillimonas minor TaxID=2697024 RepID=A0A842HJW6_9BURK|nr:hypothetical protein [Pusillimonas minor]MBC2768597.1 hypothetical protein [Pusillimonas minor]
MMTEPIKLPPEFRSGNSIPVERATITRERMVEILTEAVGPYIETLFKIGEHLGINYQAARTAPGKPSDVYIAAIEDAPQSQDREDAKFLQDEDQHDLHRFIETTEDGQGYDIGKERIKRLTELGVVSNQGFGRYSVTMFGYWCHEKYWHQNPSLPLKTIDEHNAVAALDHARRVEGNHERVD